MKKSIFGIAAAVLLIAGFLVFNHQQASHAATPVTAKAVTTTVDAKDCPPCPACPQGTKATATVATASVAKASEKACTDTYCPPCPKCPNGATVCVEKNETASK